MQHIAGDDFKGLEAYTEVCRESQMHHLYWLTILAVVLVVVLVVLLV